MAMTAKKAAAMIRNTTRMDLRWRIFNDYVTRFYTLDLQERAVVIRQTKLATLGLSVRGKTILDDSST